MTDDQGTGGEDFKQAIQLLAHTLQGEVQRQARAGAPALVRIRPSQLSQTAPMEPALPPQNTREESARGPMPAPEKAAHAPEAGAMPISQVLSADVGAPVRLQMLEDRVIGACTRCKLHRGRNRLVFGVGNPEADLVFVGEGPGAEEDRRGVPFVGRAGELLTKMIGAMELSREQVYICNVVKCRPPNNRDPEIDEVEACEPFLQTQLAVLRPRVIVALGRCATQTLLKTRRPLGALRGRWHTYQGVDFLPTYHPAFLLRSPQNKRAAWSDLQMVLKRLQDPNS